MEEGLSTYKGTRRHKEDRKRVEVRWLVFAGKQPKLCRWQLWADAKRGGESWLALVSETSPRRHMKRRILSNRSQIGCISRLLQQINGFGGHEIIVAILPWHQHQEASSIGPECEEALRSTLSSCHPTPSHARSVWLHSVRPSLTAHFPTPSINVFRVSGVLDSACSTASGIDIVQPNAVP